MVTTKKGPSLGSDNRLPTKFMPTGYVSGTDVDTKIDNALADFTGGVDQATLDAATVRDMWYYGAGTWRPNDAAPAGAPATLRPLIWHCPASDIPPNTGVPGVQGGGVRPEGSLPNHAFDTIEFDVT